jgi:hypothetical protein
LNEHPIESLSAYLDDEMSVEERGMMEHHLASCEMCRSMVTDLTEIRLQVSSYFGAIEAPQGLELKVLASLSKPSPSTVTLGEKAGITAIPIAAILAIVFLLAVYGSTMLKLILIVFNFIITVAYVFSHVASSVPLLWGSSFAIAILLIVFSGISIRRILRSTTQ